MHSPLLWTKLVFVGRWSPYLANPNGVSIDGATWAVQCDTLNALNRESLSSSDLLALLPATVQ